MKRSVRLLAMASVLATILGAADQAEALNRGGKMVYARNADSLFLDPVLLERNVDIWVLSNLYDTLLEPSADGKTIVPGLASGYEVSADGLTFTLKLRSGVKFSDGSPITVGDVKWSLDRARNPNNGAWNFTLESLDSIETQGEDTVILHLKHPDPALAAALAIFNSSIMPEKAFEATAGADEGAKAKAFAEHPIGSGPFILESWQRGTQMVLKRNPNYWQMGEDGKPLPYLDELDFQIIPRRCDPNPEAAGRRGRWRRVHSLFARRRIEGRSQSQHGALPLDQGELPHPERAAEIERRQRQPAGG